MGICFGIVDNGAGAGGARGKWNEEETAMRNDQKGTAAGTASCGLLGGAARILAAAALAGGCHAALAETFIKNEFADGRVLWSSKIEPGAARAWEDGVKPLRIPAEGKTPAPAEKPAQEQPVPSARASAASKPAKAGSLEQRLAKEEQALEEKRREILRLEARRSELEAEAKAAAAAAAKAKEEKERLAAERRAKEEEARMRRQAAEEEKKRAAQAKAREEARLAEEKAALEKKRSELEQSVKAAQAEVLSEKSKMESEMRAIEEQKRKAQALVDGIKSAKAAAQTAKDASQKALLAWQDAEYVTKADANPRYGKPGCKAPCRPYEQAYYDRVKQARDAYERASRKEMEAFAALAEATNKPLER